jgi:hypothetical protein
MAYQTSRVRGNTDEICRKAQFQNKLYIYKQNCFSWRAPSYGGGPFELASHSSGGLGENE